MAIDLTCFNWVQLIKKADLPSNAKLLAFYLSTFMNAEHDIAWPSQSRISNETGLSEPTVRKWLQYLNENGWLVTRRKARVISTGSQNYHHNEYLINIPEQRVNDLLSDMSRGKNGSDQRVNESRAEGKQLTTNNNVNNNVNNKDLMSGKPDPKAILIFLNEKTGKKYQPVKANLNLISARLKEYSEDQLRQVIAKKCREWGTDDKMAQYLRPKTLFNATNFANYAGELV